MNRVYDKVTDEWNKDGSPSFPEELARREQSLEGGGNLASTSGEKAQLEALNTKHAQVEPDAAGQVGKGYTPEEAAPTNKRPRIFRLTKKRGAILGGTLGASAVGGITFLSLTFGPLQFVHIAQLLKGADFSSQQDSDDESLARLYRYIHHLRLKQPEKVRLSLLGNKLADRFEVRLRAAGLTSTYTNLFGYLNGYAVDRSFPEYRGMNDQQLTKHMKEKYNVDLVRGETLSSSPGARGKMVIDGRKVGYFKNRKFMREKMLQSGSWRTSTAVGSRLLSKRGAVTFHPIKKLDQKILRKTEDMFAKMRERRTAAIKQGATPTLPVTEVKPNQEGSAAEQEQAASNAEETKANADEVIGEGKQADADQKAGKQGALTRFQNSLTAKITLGGAAAASIPCILRAIADESSEIKQKEVIKPAMRMSYEYISLGSQAQSGDDIAPEQGSFYQSYLTGKGADGKETTWSDARAIQAIDPNGFQGGPDASETLKTINKGTPFDFLNEGATGATFDVVCSTVVQGTLLIVAFIGGPVGAAVGTAASLILVPRIITAAAEWMSGNALNIEAKGAELGNTLRYGSHLAANEQAFASGGVPLSKEEEQQLYESNLLAQHTEFNEKSFAYRLLNPSDYRTPVAKLIDRYSNQNALTTMASAVRAFTGTAGSVFGNIGNLFTGRSLAAAAPYDFGIPKIGFSQAKMNDPRFENPYELGVVPILEGPEGQTYIDRAQACMAVTIAQDGEGYWNATSTKDTIVDYKALKDNDCADPQNEEWTRIQFFIKYSVVMASAACYEGVDDQACSDVGFDSAASGPLPGGGNGGGGGTPVAGGGNVKELAQKILDNPNIRFQVEPGQRNAFKSVATSGTQRACGRDIPISADLLSVLLKVAETYKIVIGVFAAGHGCDSGLHPKGMAVDINGVTKGSVSTGNRLHFNTLNNQQEAMVKEFYEFVANTLPKGKGGMGQSDCFSRGMTPAKIAGPIYFTGDTCNHLHVDVRPN